MKIKYIKHTADIQFEVSARKIENVFSGALLAMNKSFCKSKIKKKKKKDISVEGNNLESLMYNFLEEFLVLFDSENFIASKIKKIKIDLEKFKLRAEVTGDSSTNYEFYSDIKAITYNEMVVEKVRNLWKARVTLDV